MTPFYNVEAAKWAEQNAGSAYPDLTKNQREVLIIAVTEFIQQSKTLSYVTDMLLKEFSPEQAKLIAITEITRAYAHAAQIEGEKLGKEHPDVKVIKWWSTHNDDQVCPLCKGLDGKEVEIDKPFAEGIFIPPAHEGCRCWIESCTLL
jgi:hypothetical protein